MAKLHVTIDSDLPPERVLAAARDVSGRRTEPSSTLGRKLYELYEATGTHSEIGLHVRPRDDGGSRIEIFSHRRARGLKGHVVGAMVQVVGRKVVVESLRKRLETGSQNPASAPRSPVGPPVPGSSRWDAAPAPTTYRAPQALAEAAWTHIAGGAELPAIDRPRGARMKAGPPGRRKAGDAGAPPLPDPWGTPSRCHPPHALAESAWSHIAGGAELLVVRSRPAPPRAGSLSESPRSRPGGPSRSSRPAR
jgi:hypothetical protein